MRELNDKEVLVAVSNYKGITDLLQKFHHHEVWRVEIFSYFKHRLLKRCMWSGVVLGSVSVTLIILKKIFPQLSQ